MKFAFAIIGATAMAVITTATVGYLVSSPPRGFTFWLGVGFLCVIEFIAGLLVLNHFSRARSEYRPSGATLSAVYGIAAAYAVLALLAIVIYWMVRKDDGSQDGIFAAIFMVLTVVMSLLAFLLYAYDLHFQSSKRPADATRAQHKISAKSLAPLLSSLRTFKTDDDSLRHRASVALKKLETIETALSHSHGGGSGSWEGGGRHPAPQQNAENLESCLKLLTNIGHQVLSGTAPLQMETLDELEPCLSETLLAIQALELH
jgi:hypothetical protein